MQAARVNGRAIHFSLVEPRGEGSPSNPAVVFVNSLGTDLRIWDEVVARLPSSWRCLRYDFAGHGLSDFAGDISIEDHAADLLALIDYTGLERVFVVGLSIGGMIAQALAAHYPARVRALCLLDTAPKIGVPEMWAARMEAIRKVGLDGIAEGVLERWFSEEFRVGRPVELALWRAMLTRTPAAGYLSACAAIRDADLTAKAAGIKAPALFVCGSRDGATPPDLVRAAAKTLPNARYIEIEGVGHLPPVEAAERTAGEIRAFFTECGA